METTMLESRMWRRWRRFRLRRGLMRDRVKVLAFVGGLVALDWATKHWLVTEEWAIDTRPVLPSMAAIALVILLFFALYPPLVYPAMAMVAGTIGNFMSGSSVANPFQIQYTHYLIAFNLADVFLMAGVVAIFVIILWRPLTTPIRSATMRP